MVTPNARTRTQRLLPVMALACMAGLSACGFTPLYGSSDDPATASAAAILSTIAIAEPRGEDRLNRMMEGALSEALSPDGMRAASPRYRLETQLRDSRRGLLIQDDTTITRYNFRVTATWRLIDVNDDRVVLDGKAHSTISYNVAESQYSTLVAREDAERRATREIAEAIRLRFAVAFAGPDCCRAPAPATN